MSSHAPLSPLALLVALTLASPAIAGDRGEGDKKSSQESAEAAPDPRILAPAQLRRAITPHERKIGVCYKDHALGKKGATGELRLELIVHKNGSVFRLHVVAPGLKKSKKLARCIEQLSKDWAFPQKPGFTHAVIPFFYLRTHAKGAGPLKSCWAANGCPELHRKAKREREARDKAGAR